VTDAQAQPQKRPNRRRKWLFRLAAMTLAPAVFLLVCEVGLRAARYGYDTRFFEPARDGRYYVIQPAFGRRFFLHDRWPVATPQQFPIIKSHDTYRVFVLGGSAAEGFPAPSFSFSRMLERFLRYRYPSVRFEVVNTAMTAINSNVLLPIARECAGYQPDLFIIYAGNNEVVGPFGPATIFSGFCASLRTIRLSLWLRSTKVGQLIRSLFVTENSKDRNDSGRIAMADFANERLSPVDPAMEGVYAHFRQNLRDIVGSSRSCGAKVILCTVATNVRQCAPFASMHSAGLSERELRQWERIYEDGVALESAGKYAEAIRKYRQAASIDDQWADLHYRLGRCLLALEKFDDAREEFILARDLDALQFRADSRINAIIREVAAGADGVRLVDAERAFAESKLTPHHLPGTELFYEHVHMNFEGNYLLAKTIFREVEQALPEWILQRRGGGLAPSIDQMADELALTGLDRWWIAFKISQQMIAGAPFTNQLDHAERMAAAAKKEHSLQHYTYPESIDRALERCLEELERHPDDLPLKKRCRKFITFRKEFDQFRREFPGHLQQASEKPPERAGKNSDN